MDNVFSYREGTTFLHTRLHPLTKMVSFLAIVIISGLWLDVRYLLPLFIFGLLMARVARVPPKYFLFIVVALGLTWFPTLRSTIAQAQPEYFQVLPQAWAATPIATVDINLLKPWHARPDLWQPVLVSWARDPLCHGGYLGNRLSLYHPHQ